MHSDEKVDPFAPDEDTPVWTKEEIARARPGREIFAELGLEPPRPRGRPSAARRKRSVTLRIDADVLEAFKATGPGWQTRMNEVLRDAAATTGTGQPRSGDS